MNRREFIQTAGLSATVTWLGQKLFAQSEYKIMEVNEVIPQKFFFKDDGKIPNSEFPLLVYASAFTLKGNQGAEWVENRFKQNNWYNSWRWGVYPFHHYHSSTHEVLGCFQGEALLHLGGEQGEKVNVKAGDIVVIPAGVGHKCISHRSGFTMVGAYPEGRAPDLMKGESGERPQADKNIKAVPFPTTDPFTGTEGGLLEAWKK